MPQWQRMMKLIREKGIQMVAMEVDERGDADFVRMRMVAILEAQETRERGVSESSNVSVFFA
jgi:hypothetical protein